MNNIEELENIIKTFCNSKIYKPSVIKLLPENIVQLFEKIIQNAIKKGNIQNKEIDLEKIKLLSSFIRRHRLENFKKNLTAGTVTITFGEVAENGPGMEKIGTISPRGFTPEDLLTMQGYFTSKGILSEYYDLNKQIGGEGDKAAVLVLRNAVNYIIGRNNSDVDLYTQLLNFKWDNKAKMRGEVKNKLARHNLVFSDFNQTPNYDEGKGTVIRWDNIPFLEIIKNKLVEYFGHKAANLHGEGNYYYDTKSCGIGFHGDSERKKVIALRLGETIPIVFQWYISKPVGQKKNYTMIGDPFSTLLNHGDVYVMSEKATGNDWMKKNTYHLRHSAGCDKYTNQSNKKK